MAVKPGGAAERRLGNRQHFTLHWFTVITGLLRALMGLIRQTEAIMRPVGPIRAAPAGRVGGQWKKEARRQRRGRRGEGGRGAESVTLTAISCSQQMTNRHVLVSFRTEPVWFPFCSTLQPKHCWTLSSMLRINTRTIHNVSCSFLCSKPSLSSVCCFCQRQSHYRALCDVTRSVSCETSALFHASASQLQWKSRRPTVAGRLQTDVLL